MFNRVFDDKKYNSMIVEKDYVYLREGIEAYMKQFLKKPLFNEPNWIIQARMDRLTKERTKLSLIKGKKDKLKYLMYLTGLKK